jgi:hypothetical protein
VTIGLKCIFKEQVMFELTQSQRKELSLPEPRAIDPATQQAYVLVREELYQRMKGLLYEAGEWNEQVLRQQLACSITANGWDAPGMDDYDNYDEVRARSCH